MPPPTRRDRLASALRPASLRLDPAAARSRISAGALLVDVRRADDRTQALEGAARVTPDDIPAYLKTLPAGVEIVLACT
jgi:rhodanese-related sulfurtransferase